MPGVVKSHPHLDDTPHGAQAGQRVRRMMGILTARNVSDEEWARIVANADRQINAAVAGLPRGGEAVMFEVDDHTTDEEAQLLDLHRRLPRTARQSVVKIVCGIVQAHGIVVSDRESVRPAGPGLSTAKGGGGPDRA